MSTPPVRSIRAQGGERALPRIDAKWWVLVAVGAGTFMSALDSSVVNTVLPVIQRSLGGSVAAIEWVVTIYLLVLSGLLLSFGRLGDLRGHKPIYLRGLVVLVASSAMCGLATTALALIAFRALEALGAAMLLANSPAILTKSFPAAQRGQALGWQASMTYLGLTVGPALGGWLTTRFIWRLVFYINVPVGLAALWLSLRFIPRDPSPPHSEHFDFGGAAAWTCGLAALLFALNRGYAWGWRSAPILSMFGVAVLLLSGFVAVERRARNPMLDLSLFWRRAFAAATTSSVLNYICLYTIVFLLPFYLIQGRGISAAETGLLLTAQSLVRAVAAPLSGTWSDRVGSRLPGMLGMAILACGLFLLSQLRAESSLVRVGVALTFSGLGAGIFVSPNSSALMGAAPRHQQGIAAGVLATARYLGMALGIGLAGATFTTVLHRAGAVSLDVLSRAVDAGFLVAAGVAALGVVTCAAHSTRKAVAGGS